MKFLPSARPFPGIRHLICLAAASLIGGPVEAWSAEPAPAWDTFSDTWVATDGLGRSLPERETAGPPRQDRFTGLFYFLWLGRHGEAGPYDISKILATDPGAMSKPDSPLWGALQAPHHWGEPLFGYYVSDDDSVLAKHAQMLADAGVDTVIFDVTNQLSYPESWQALGRVWSSIRERGGRTPQMAFLCPFGSPQQVLHELYRDLYAPGKFQSLWFQWEGKPLILANPAALDQSETSAAIRRTFTFRTPQPDYFTGPTAPHQWGWLEVHPQHAFPDDAGRVEEVTVGVAQNALDGKLSVLSNPKAYGRSFHQGQQPGLEGQDFSGRNFAGQWERAFALDPAFVFITGWNEWIAGRFQKPSGFYGDGPVTFVDQFSREFSRDCEPMLGGHGDAYYYQLISNIRRFKGVRTFPSVQSAPIAVDGSFSDWAAVSPEFRDDIGDPVHRDFRGWGKDSRYVNQTGRNDIIAAKIAANPDTIFCYVRTREALTSPSDANWMLLFLDTDHDAKTGWLGYEYVINRSRPQPELTRLEHYTETGYQWSTPVEIPCRSAGSELELAIPRAALGLAKGFLTLDFKWADNIQQTGEWSDFTLNGDAAPNDRFNYRAEIRQGQD